MPLLNPHMLHARALRADLLANPAVWLPRREVLLEWLVELLARAQDPQYVFTSTETDDLVAIDRFLRANDVPAVPVAR